MTKESVENYCQGQDLSMVEAVNSWNNWTIVGECNGDKVVKEEDNLPEAKMTIMQADYKSISN